MFHLDHVETEARASSPGHYRTLHLISLCTFFSEVFCFVLFCFV